MSDQVPRINLFDVTPKQIDDSVSSGQSTSGRDTGPYSHHDHGVCPICQKSMAQVRLRQGESAFFCHDHRITMPMPAC